METQGISSWLECSERCRQNIACQAWSYEVSTRKCSQTAQTTVNAFFSTLGVRGGLKSCTADHRIMSAVYTQICMHKPDIADANNQLLSFLKNNGATNVKIVETKSYSFFPSYIDRDLNNGMLYTILKMQGKNKIWYIGKGAYLDNPGTMMKYNKMIMDRYKLV